MPILHASLLRRDGLSPSVASRVVTAPNRRLVCTLALGSFDRLPPSPLSLRFPPFQLFPISPTSPDPLGSVVEFPLEWRRERRIREKVVQFRERVGLERVLIGHDLGRKERREIGRGGLEHVQEKERFLLLPAFAGPCRWAENGDSFDQ